MKMLGARVILQKRVAPLIELVRNHVPSWEDAQEMGFQTLPYFNILNTTNTYVFVPFTGVEERINEFQEPLDLRSNHFQGGGDDAILPRKGPITRAMSKRLQEDWARAVEEGPRVLMNLRIDF